MAGPTRHEFTEMHRLIVISPAQLVANTDNWNPTGLSTGATVIRASTDASRNLTGIVAPTIARFLILENVGAQDLVLVHDATSTAGNRFYCPDNSDVTLAQNTWAWLVYDLTSSRWRVLAAGAGAIPAGTYVLTTEGGQETINARGVLGATETIDPTLGNIFTGTLDANCIVTLDQPVGSGGATLEGWFTQSGGPWTLGFAASGGGTFQWDGGVTPTIPSTGTFRVVLERIPATTNDWVGDLVGGGAISPLTTKGDLWGYSTTDARFPVGTNGHLVNADSTAALGVAYISPADVVETAGHWEPLMDGGSPYEPLDDGSGTDWLFVWVP